MGNIYRFIEPAILRRLVEEGPAHGYDLSESISQYALCDTAVDRPALYRTLRTLEDNGFVNSHWQTKSAGPSRRVYSITAAGRQHLRDWAELMERLGRALSSFSRHVRRTL